MKTFNATDAKNRFGELLDSAQAGPVAIQKNGRNTAVLLSAEEYERFLELKDKSSVDEDGVNPLVKQLHAESVERFSDLYKKLAQ